MNEYIYEIWQRNNHPNSVWELEGMYGVMAINVVEAIEQANQCMENKYLRSNYCLTQIRNLKKL